MMMSTEKIYLPYIYISINLFQVFVYLPDKACKKRGKERLHYLIVLVELC